MKIRKTLVLIPPLAPIEHPRHLPNRGAVDTPGAIILSSPRERELGTCVRTGAAEPDDEPAERSAPCELRALCPLVSY